MPSRKDRARAIADSDRAVFAFLACVTTLVGGLAVSAYVLMQPASVPNPGVAAYTWPTRSTIELPTPNSPYWFIEQSAVAAAHEQNRSAHEVDALRAFAAVESVGQPQPKAPARAVVPQRSKVARAPFQLEWRDGGGSWSRSPSFGERPMWRSYYD